MNKLVKKCIYGLSSLALTLPVLVYGQTGGFPVPQGNAIKLTDISGSVSAIAGFMIYIGIAVAVIFIIWGGITYMTAGGDDTKLGTAKKRIIWGIIGAAIIIGVGTIIKTLQLIFFQGPSNFFNF